MDAIYEKRGYLLEDFRLFHLRDAQGIQTDYHYHEFCKLLLLISGSGRYAIEGNRYVLKPGDLVLLDHRCVHKPEFEPGQPYERIILYLSPAFLQRESRGACQLEACFSGLSAPVLRLSPAQQQLLRTRLDQLEQALQTGGFGCEILCNSLLLQLLVELARIQQQDSSLHPEPLHPTDPTILGILSYLDRHLTEPLTIDRLAEEFYLSKYHMMRRFRQETGTTIHCYLQERRLFLARELLAQGKSATQICYEVGFGSYAAFARAYGRLFGVTPTGRPLATAVETVYE